MKMNYHLRQSFVLACILSVMTIFCIPAQAQSTKKSQQKSGYIFLALPSGTIWKETNEEGYYSFAEAAKKYGNQLPTKEQWQELIDNCNWVWTGKGYKVTDKRGVSIYLPAAGYKSSFGNTFGVGESAFYWANTEKDNVYSWGLWMEHTKNNENNIHIFTSKQDYYQSVRLVK